MQWLKLLKVDQGTGSAVSAGLARHAVQQHVPNVPPQLWHG